MSSYIEEYFFQLPFDFAYLPGGGRMETDAGSTAMVTLKTMSVCAVAPSLEGGTFVGTQSGQVFHTALDMTEVQEMIDDAHAKGVAIYDVREKERRKEFLDEAAKEQKKILRDEDKKWG